MLFKYFYPRMNKPNMRNNIIGISSFRNGVDHPFSPTGFYFRATLWKVAMKCKNNCFLILGPFSQIYIFEVATFFLSWCLSNQLNFSVIGRVYKIHVFGEAFSLLAAIAMITEKSVFFLFPWQSFYREQIRASHQSSSLSNQTTASLKNLNQT